MKTLFISVLVLFVVCMSNALYAQDNLIATEILGRPTNHSITLNAVAGFDADAFILYGIETGIYTKSTDTITVPNGNPIEIVIDSLDANTRYFYRFCYRRNGTTNFTVRDEHYFHTQRARGSTFRFTIEADPHLYDKKGSPTLMKIAMQNQQNDGGDFLLDLGDTFGDDHTPYTTTQADENQLHLNYRPFFGMVCHSAPLFFCLGNHEGENGFYLNENPPNNLAVYATNARHFYYPNPVPDSFYSGNTVSEGYGIGLPENYYAWEWGDALFIVLDVYRHYTASAKPDGWDWTIGDSQYVWLKRTLENSTSKYKFVFAHHLDGEVRGAAIWTKKFEWGGNENNGTTWGFDTKRPGWAMPIHQLMVANGVNIFFQGHDHLFAREVVDGLVYQEVPMPCDSTYIIGLENAHYYTSDTLPPSGHMRVTVAESGVQVDYVKAVEPWDETPEHPNGEVAYTYTIGALSAKYTLSVIQPSYGTIAPGTTLIDSGGSQRFTFNPTTGYHLDSVIVDGMYIPDSTSGYTFTNVTENHTITARFSSDSPTIAPTFLGTELLGSPTDNSIKLNVIPGVDMNAFVEYGSASGSYSNRTDTLLKVSGTPFSFLIDGLVADTKYYYRFGYRTVSDTVYTLRDEHSFHTRRPRGHTFVFDVQADPHLGIPNTAQRDSSVDTTLYKRTLRNELADNPDFLLDLGDTFMNEKYYFSNYDITKTAYLAHRPYFGMIGHSIPLYLVNGNHEGELGWKLNGTANNLALWSVRARNLYYPNPVPGGFYSGSSTNDPNLMLDTNIVNKKRDSYYSWEWGNALIVVLDPFWYTTAKPSSYTTNADEGWKFSLGQAQYNWLKQTLEKSTATFKFVFTHNLVGGNSKDGRGGIEAAPFYEWGGKDIQGTYEWDSKRLWSGEPIHDLLVQNNVTMLLHGHDHFYFKQQLDSVIYQECPQPSLRNYSDVPNSAASYGYFSGKLLGNSGHMRFTVTDSALTVDYIRAYKPEDETVSRHNGDIAYSYTIKAVDKSVPLIATPGWNLISIPTKQLNRGRASIFPTSVSSAFSYFNGYVSTDMFEYGVGYWIKFSEADTFSLKGTPISLDSVTVNAGWNIVGSTSDMIPVSSIQSNPPGLVTSQFFEYTTHGYSISDTIKPGRGYWVKVNQSGTLIFVSPFSKSSSSSRIEIVATKEMPPPSPEQSMGQSFLPKEYCLDQNYPNPFNPKTTIRYQLPVDSYVTLKLYNSIGEEVMGMVNGIQEAGYKSLSLDASHLASGLYFYRLSATTENASFTSSKKLLLIK